MAVSTATYNWYYDATLVTAEGTLAEVCTELTAGADSSGTLNHRENLILFTCGDTSGATAIWWSPKKQSRVHDATGDWAHLG